MADVFELSDLELNIDSSVEGDVTVYQRGDKMTFKLSRAIRKGDNDEVVKWLKSIPPDQRKEKVNTVKFSWIFSDTVTTALQLAAENNQPEIAKILLNEGADPNIARKTDGFSVLHCACSNSSDEDVTELVKLIVDRGGNVNAVDDTQRTLLHTAADNGNAYAVKYLLEKEADMELKDEDEAQPIHLASSEGHFKVVDILVKRNPQCVHWKDNTSRTPLHKVCRYSSDIQSAKCLVNADADVNAKDDDGRTPLLDASRQQTNTELVKILLEAGAEASPPKVKGIKTPLQMACYYGCSGIVSLLIKHGARVGSKALEMAVSEGYEDIAEQLILTPQWALAMRHIFKDSLGKETTPLREMIRKMPDVAEVVLNKCTVNDPDIKNLDDQRYRVVYNYEFMEDTKDDRVVWLGNEAEQDEKREYGSNYKEIRRRAKNYGTSWGPVKFKKGNHPLAIMVESKCLNLLTHPLVGSLLHHKWKKFGLCGYFFNLFTYCAFLIFLTTFALIVENPKGQSCAMNISETSSFDCGVNQVRYISIYISAAIVIFMALVRLAVESIQLILQFPRYFLDGINWIEIVLFLSSIIFVWVFHNDCLCPLQWQWQVGVVAVFLGWIVLIIFISKFPLTGIYVLMFVNVFATFLKVLLLSILLVVAFALAFYLAFAQPEIMRSPFSTPARSLLKTMTMTTGEFDFDSIFRQDPVGESDDAEEIPFPQISYILWIGFVILMPVLLTNMLVGLAVGDIQTVQDEAELKKLALQVEQVLTVEELLPKRLRSHFTTGYKDVYPNETASWRKQLHFIFWGGERYDTRASIEKVLHPHENENERLRKKTEKLLDEVENLKKMMNGMQEMVKDIANRI